MIPALVTYSDRHIWRRYRISFTWRSGGRATTLCLGLNRADALQRFVSRTPGIAAACVVEEVAL